MATRSRWNPAVIGANWRGGGPGQCRSTHISATGSSTDTVSTYTDSAGRPGWPAQRYRGRWSRPLISRWTSPSVDLRVAVRRLRELRSPDSGCQPLVDSGVRRRRPYGWVIRPLISYLQPFDNIFYYFSL